MHAEFIILKGNDLIIDVDRHEPIIKLCWFW